MWRQESLSVEIMATSNQLIHALIKRQNQPEWLFSAIYASPNPKNRQRLWDSLRGARDVHDLAWLVAGDFNQVSSPQEKRGSAPVSQSRCANLNLKK